MPPSCRFPTRVAIPQQLFFSGVVRGESAMKSERDIGSKVKYEVTVSVLVRPVVGPLPSWCRERLRHVARL